MNHSYRIERLCTGQCSAGEASALSQKEVTQAFTTLRMGIETVLGRMPQAVSGISTRHTQDGLDVRLHSSWDGTTVRNLVSSVVADVNAGHPGLNLSVITRPLQAIAPARPAHQPMPVPIMVAGEPGHVHFAA